MSVERLKESFDKFSTSDKIRFYMYVDEEIQRIKKENPRTFSSLLCYVKNPEKNKTLKYKSREKLKQQETNEEGGIDKYIMNN